MQLRASRACFGMGHMCATAGVTAVLVLNWLGRDTGTTALCFRTSSVVCGGCTSCRMTIFGDECAPFLVLTVVLYIMRLTIVALYHSAVSTRGHKCRNYEGSHFSGGMVPRPPQTARSITMSFCSDDKSLPATPSLPKTARSKMSRSLGRATM